MMHDLASTWLELGLDESRVDVPVTLAHGKSQWPLGRYLRRSLRTMIGKSPNTPQAALDDYAAQMQPLREAAFNNSRSLKSEVLKSTLGKRIQIEAKMKRNQRRSI